MSDRGGWDGRKKKAGFTRRRFLKGAFGVTMALPFLDAFGSNAFAAGAGQIKPRFFVCVRSGNGVRQEAGSELEKFWPMATGALTRAGLEMTDSEGDARTVGELKDHLAKLLVVSGTKYSFPGNGCGHSGGGNQVLTGTPPSALPDKNRSLATGESLDNLIQRVLCPSDPEPLTLASGRSSSYLNEVLSFRQPPSGETNAILRSAERSPWEVYKSLFGTPDGMSSSFMEQQIAVQRTSVNDILREQLTALRSSPALSRQDQIRMELHQDSIRDLEVRMMECHLPDTRWAELEDADINSLHTQPVNTEAITFMMMDIIALCFACDLKRAVTLQIGNGNDGTTYSINGPDYPFHWISHRIQGDGASGSAPSIDNAADLHYQIDKLQARMFGYLVGKLDEYATPTGTLLDDCVALWTNDLANGVGHSYRNLPHVIAGSGGGYLQQGLHVDARDTGTAAGDGWVAHNQLFNTIANAVGVGEALGAPVTDFGHKGGQGHDQPAGGELPGVKV